MSESERDGLGWRLPWVSNAPTGWDVRRMTHALRLSMRRNDDGSCDELLSLSASRGIIPKAYEDDSQVRSGAELAKYFLVTPGQFVVNPMWVMHGSLGMASISGVISPDYRVYDPAPDVDPRYLHHLLKTSEYLDLYALLARGTTTYDRRISKDDFNQLPVLVPALGVQRTIADFLDRKTAAIDALIEKKQKLLDLLAEKRSALINQAVSNGITPGTPSTSLMGSSEFFSAMPTHWTLLRLKFLLHDVKDGPHYSPPYVDKDAGGYLFLSARNVKVDGWSFDDAKYVSEELYRDFSRRVRPRRGDVLYTKGGTTGVARAVDFDSPFQVWVHIAVLKVLPDRVNPYYLAYALNSPGCYAQAQLFTRGATNNDLGLTRMVNIELPWPCRDEQERIVAWLDERVGKVDEARQKCAIQIERLQEYRDALIAAAVTGQLDIPAAEAA